MEDSKGASEATVADEPLKLEDEVEQSASNPDVPVSKAEELPVEDVEDSSKTENGCGDTKMEDANQVASNPGEDNDTRNWDHSSRKVIVRGIYKYLDGKKTRKIVDQWIRMLENVGKTVEIANLRKPPNDNWVCLTLTEDHMVQTLVDFVNEGDFQSKGRPLFAKKADTNTEDRKRRGDAADDGMAKRQRLEEKTRQARRPVTEDEVRAKITPLWKLSAEKQEERKLMEMVKKCAFKVVQGIKSRFRTIDRSMKVYDWVEQKRCINVEKMVSVPTPFRNKCEFTFGYRYLFDEVDNGPAQSSAESNGKTQSDEKSDGKTPNGEPPTEPTKQEGTNESTGAGMETEKGEQRTEKEPQKEPRKVPAVGFMATGWAGGVCRPHCCANIPPEACAVADLFDEFLQQSTLTPYDSVLHQGFWRVLTLRTSRRTGECMLIIQHTPMSGGIGESVDFTKDFAEEKTRLTAMLTDKELAIPNDTPNTPIKVTSIFFQEYDGVSSPSPDHPVQHAYGKTTLQERLGKCTFQISPGAFFQVNTQGAEILYQKVVDKVREVTQDPKDTLLFDVCCGTGTIGLTCMKEGVVGKVVGVDISEPAIRDAKINAELNGYGAKDDDENADTRFVASRAEFVMSKEIGKARRLGRKFVAVVDPAREGLHQDVIRALKANEMIRRVVYVSCNPTGSLPNDASLLCAPPTKRYPGRAFRVTSANPVDMFPLTTHCEMIMVFDRVKDTDIHGSKKSAETKSKVDDGEEGAKLAV